MQIEDELKGEKRKEFRKKDNLSKLQQRMYSRAHRGFLPWRRRYNQPIPKSFVGDDWRYTEHDKEDNDLNKKEEYPIDKVNKIFPRKNGSSILMKSIFVISVLFFLVTIIIASLYLSADSATMRYDKNVKLSVEGVTSISSGDVIELQLLVINNNDKPLEMADLVVEYPDGAVSPADFITPLKGQRIPLGKIEARTARRGALRAVVLGSNNSTQSIKIELQYRIKGSSALYSEVTEYPILITGDALGIAIEGDSQVIPGQISPITLNIKSHANTVLNGVYIDLKLPFGVKVVDSSPKVIENDGSQDAENLNKRWIIGELRPGEERELRLAISADGQTGDEKHLQFTAGTGLIREGESSTVSEKNSVTLAQEVYTFKIQRPFLETVLSSGGVQLDKTIAYSGKEMYITLDWRNNLDVPITDASVKVELGGVALNRLSVKPDRFGFYMSVNDLLLWDSKTTGGKLKTIAPGQSEKFSFKVSPLGRIYLQKLRKPELTFVVHATGKRLSESNVPEVLVANKEYVVKVSTDLMFDAYALHDSSPFGSVGPMPPKVEYETQYGITWTVSNTTSDVSDAVVKAELPHYVRWVGVTSPADEQLIYNKVDHSIEWVLGTVEAGVGVDTPARKVSFAIGLVPSLSQLGTEPDLILNQVLTGADTYTGAELTVPGPVVTTNLDREPGFRRYNASVVK